MYNAYMGLKRAPFSMTPDPDFLFLTEKHREALAGLLFAVDSRKGFLVLTGDAGTGKTTLLRRILRSMPSERAQFSYVLNPTLEPGEFLEMAMLDFGIERVPTSKAQRLMVLQDFLLRNHRENKTSVLIIDEAHKLTPELLEEIRLLTNFETAEQKLLQIVLAGQTELSALLNREELRQLKQRIAIRIGIGPLAPEEVGEYIRSRWVCAGATSELPFSRAALTLIGQYSRGIPRVINAICDNALISAFGDEVRTVEDRHVVEVASDLQLAAPATRNGATRQVSEPAKLNGAQVFDEAASRYQASSTDPVEGYSSLPFRTLDRYMPPTVKGWRWRSRPRLPKGNE